MMFEYFLSHVLLLIFVRELMSNRFSSEAPSRHLYVYICFSVIFMSTFIFQSQQ